MHCGRRKSSLASLHNATANYGGSLRSGAAPRIHCDRSGREKLARIDRAIAASQLKMELRLADVAGRAYFGDRFSAIDLIALFDEQLVAMRIGRHPAVRMLDQDEVAVAAQLVAGIGD